MKYPVYKDINGEWCLVKEFNSPHAAGQFALAMTKETGITHFVGYPHH